MRILLFVLLTAVCQLAFAVDSSSQTGIEEQKIIHWHTTTGFQPFAGLVRPTEVSDKWLPKKKNDQDTESFAEWYVRIAATAGDGPLESPYAAYARDERLGPWEDKPQHADWKLPPPPSADDPWHDSAKCDPALGECYRADYVRPTSVAVTVSVPTAPIDSQCKWSSQIKQFISKCTSEISIPVALTPKGLADSKAPIVCVAINGAPQKCEHVAARQIVVVGFGDSFSAGEGNPDVATSWSLLADKPINKNTYSWLKENVAAGARWMDARCHRSFWSHQSYIAMRLAVLHPHEVVTLLNYSCSGAAVLDGILVPQFSPPGEWHGGCDDPAQKGTDPHCRVRHSQVMQATLDLCDVSPLSIAGHPSNPDVNQNEPWEDCSLPRGSLDPLVAKIAGLQKQACLDTKQLSSTDFLLQSYEYYLSDDRSRDVQHLDVGACPQPQQHWLQPDVVLVSIGGNDIGFGPLIRWALYPENGPDDPLGLLEKAFLLNGLRRIQVVCPAGTPTGKLGCSRYAENLIKELPKRYSLMIKTFTDLLWVTPDHVAQIAYPDPLRKNASDLSTNLCSDVDNNEVQHENGWDAFHYILNIHVPNIDSDNMPFNIHPADAAILMSTTLTTLKGVMSQSASDLKIHFAIKAADAGVQHGFCEAGDRTHLKEFYLPSYGTSPWGAPPCVGDPSCWRPFATRGRFFRTANDSILGQQSYRDDGMSGTIHPTAQGQAAIADQLAPEVDAIVPHENPE
jgi:lysophospholipase L1-like esterase